MRNRVQLKTQNRLEINDWYDVIPSAVYYKGYDEMIFKDFYVMIYEDTTTGMLDSVFISKYGEIHYNSIVLDRKSKYYPAIQNLSSENQKSNVRKTLAVTTLRAYSMLSAKEKRKIDPKMVDLDLWDETRAGKLANEMTLIDTKKPSDLGFQMMNLGYLQTQYINSVVADIVYTNKTQLDIEENNSLVFSVGDQLDQLFDPLTEYSPEPTEKVYQPPNTVQNHDSKLMSSICQELLQVQKNFTTKLVEFLQNFILPLRIKVLNGAIPGYTTSRLNTVFPPTIDEVTRINCIYLDALKLAIPYGSFEMIKASGMTIPYFYKACMRHELAIKNFNESLKVFLNDLHRNGIPEDLNYTKQKIESVIHGSLNLTKIKMILNRLAKCQENDWNSNQLNQVPHYLASSIETIDSFAKDNLVPYQHRVFTPTGKILTELANGWPEELQYGWLTRRVVAIYDVENVSPNNGYLKDQVLIIFSDLVLFLTVLEQQNDSNFHRPSISDILMHSLINESPLKNIPLLAVNGWCDIRNVHVSTYLDDELLKFVVNDEKGILNFNNMYENTRYYKLSVLKKGSKVIELVNKAKILDKTQPFHLFKTKKSGLTVYSTAHDFANYDEEFVKSPFVVFLRISPDDLYLAANKIFFGLSIFKENNSVLLRGKFSNKNFNFERRCYTEELGNALCEIMSEAYVKYMDFEINTIDHSRLIKSNLATLTMLDDFIKNRPIKEQILYKAPERTQSSSKTYQKLLNKKSLEILTGSRNSSGSSVIRRKTTNETHKTTSSKKSIISKKSISSFLKNRSTSDESSGPKVIKQISKIFRTKSNSISGKENQHVQTVQTREALVPTVPSTPWRPAQLVPEIPPVVHSKTEVTPKPTVNVPAVESKPIDKKLDTHLTSSKSGQFKDDLYDDYELFKPLEVTTPRTIVQDTTEDLTHSSSIYPVRSPEITLSTPVLMKKTRLLPISPEKFFPVVEKEEPREVKLPEPILPVNVKPLSLAELHTSHSVRRKLSKLMDEIDYNYYNDGENNWELLGTDNLSNGGLSTVLSVSEIPPAVANRIHNYRALLQQDAPIIDRVSEKVQEVEESKIEPPVELKQEQPDDSFSITFGDIEDYGELDIDRLQINEILLQQQEKDSKQLYNGDIKESEMVDSLGQDMVKCEPQEQQFTYKNTEDYDLSENFKLENQIQLEDLTTSDFTMSSEGHLTEEESRANFTWVSPSILEGAMKDSPLKEPKKILTSKISLVQPPMKRLNSSHYYVPHEDSVRFDEPILRASSYSYLTGILDQDVQFDMEPIAEDHENLAETTMMYDNKVTENLKESSIRYLAGIIYDED